jgi:hypothetical protein
MLIAILTGLSRTNFNTINIFDTVEPDDVTASGALTTSEGGLSALVSVALLVATSLVLTAIIIVLGIFCYRRWKKAKRADEEERIDEPLLVPSDDF